MTPGAATGFTWHEWLGLAFIPLVSLHVLLSWGWVRKTWRRLRLATHPKARLNFLINSALAVMVTVVVVSGLMISEAALPAMGISTMATRRWEQLHNLTSSYLLIVVGLHLGLNWSWIAGAFRRYAITPFKQKGIDNVARQ
jgi:hypothetical protein